VTQIHKIDPRMLGGCVSVVPPLLRPANLAKQLKGRFLIYLPG
jgi:hypothetical protein